MDTLVLARPGPLRQADYRQYAGALISVNPKSLTFSLIPPVNVMCPPFSVPFDHMELEQTSWALWPQPFAIRMKNQPEIGIIVGRDTVQWIRSQTDQRPFGWDI